MEKIQYLDFKYKLGIRVKDMVTGFAGVVTGRSQLLHMCNRYNVTPEGTTPDGKLKEIYSFDEGALEVLDDKPVLEVPNPGFKHDLGVGAMDTVTLLKGVVVSRTQYLHGCNRYILQQQGPTPEGKAKECLNVDEAAIELDQAPKPVVTPRKNTGGPPTRVSRT